MAQWQAMQRPQIVPYFAQPHVFTVITDNTWYTEDVASRLRQHPFSALCVTGADRGIDNTLVRMGDIGSKVSLFGRGDFGKYGQPSITADVLLENNNTNVWMLRVMPDDANFANVVVMAEWRTSPLTTPQGEIIGFNMPGDPPPEYVPNPAFVPAVPASGGWHDPFVPGSNVATQPNHTRPAVGTDPPPQTGAIWDGTDGIWRNAANDPIYPAPMITEPNPNFINSMQTFVPAVPAVGAEFIPNPPAGSAGHVPGTPDTPEAMQRFDIKFSTVVARHPFVMGGARTHEQILEFARSQERSPRTHDSPDPVSGYWRIPLFMTRSIGRGRYGNNYSVRIERDLEMENDYGMKIYNWNIMEHTTVTRGRASYAGTLVTDVKYNVSSFINDVLNRYRPGTIPIMVHAFEDEVHVLFDAYQAIVEHNRRVTDRMYAAINDETNPITLPFDVVQLKDDVDYAGTIDIEIFDPIFGLTLNARNGELIPFYRNFTTMGEFTEPDWEVDGRPPQFMTEWPDAALGKTVLVRNCATNGADWRYRVEYIYEERPGLFTIWYDNGRYEPADASEFDGTNISIDVGIPLRGGHDGEFERIVVNGQVRKPTKAEMKMLLSREYVKAFKGEKDRFILSPARVDLDFIFDADYNLTVTNVRRSVRDVRAQYGGSTVLTEEDIRQLAMVPIADRLSILPEEVNVKGAMYDLNEFRTRNGIYFNPREGAGCELKLDCGRAGQNAFTINSEVTQVLNAMRTFLGRNTSIDFGYYQIFDPESRRRIDVTTSYFLAQRLVPHLIRNGLNRPFVNQWALIPGVLRNSFRPELDLIDWDIKERLFRGRINYYYTLDEGLRVCRAVQNTRQMDASALLEENNVRVLNLLKKTLERNNRNYLFDWNDPVARKGYTDAQMEVFRPWIGDWVHDIRIFFDANDWEQERMMMSCYCEVAFRDIIKRIILHIDINRPDIRMNNPRSIHDTDDSAVGGIF